MRIEIDKIEVTKKRSAASYPLGTLLINSTSSGLFVRLQDGKILGFGSSDVVPWIFSDGGAAEWLPAPRGTKITLEQE